MLLHAAHALRPALFSARRQPNPSILRTTLIVVGAAAAGTLLYRLLDGDGKPAPQTKSEWTYWAALGPDNYWYPWVRNPDGRHIQMDQDPWTIREYAEDAARDEVIRHGGVPVLSYGAPGTEDAVPGVEGAGPGVPKKNYVGTGWFWPNMDLFPTEDSMLRFLESIGYTGSGTGVLSGPNMEAIKRFQNHYNLVVRYLETGTALDEGWPSGLSTDGLLGPMSMQALAMVKLGLNDEDPLGSWQTAVKDGKTFAAIPVAVKQILRLGYGSFAKWMKTNAAGRRAIIRPFQDDYNCVIASTDRQPLTVDGQVGPKTAAAAAYATALGTIDLEWGAMVANC